jgi:preprotein translocase subunit YajC
MFRRVLVGGVTAAAILGAGGTALALTGSDGPTGSGTSSHDHAAGRGGHGKARLLKRLQHAEIVTKHGKGFVTHELIRGTVTAVSPSSITVQAADKTTETFTVNAATKVRVRSGGKGAAASIARVAKGDRVFVAGVGAGTPVARHVVDVKKS